MGWASIFFNTVYVCVCVCECVCVCCVRVPKWTSWYDVKSGGLFPCRRPAERRWLMANEERRPSTLYTAYCGFTTWWMTRRGIVPTYAHDTVQRICGYASTPGLVVREGSARWYWIYIILPRSLILFHSSLNTPRPNHIQKQFTMTPSGTSHAIRHLEPHRLLLSGSTPYRSVASQAPPIDAAWSLV